MVRRVFFSFHYKPDCVRASLVRNMGMVDDSKPASDNDWETITKGGEKAIQRWIDNQLAGRSCTIVLIGQNTAGRKWINYEIEKSWDEKKGILGIYIHNLKDFEKQSKKGKNPFDSYTVGNTMKHLSDVVHAYDPPYTDSKQVYAHIKRNISKWIEEAIEIRNNFNK
jgi:hypothetical protein